MKLINIKQPLLEGHSYGDILEAIRANLPNVPKPKIPTKMGALGLLGAGAGAAASILASENTLGGGLSPEVAGTLGAGTGAILATGAGNSNKQQKQKTLG